MNLADMNEAWKTIIDAEEAALPTPRLFATREEREEALLERMLVVQHEYAVAWNMGALLEADGSVFWPESPEWWAEWDDYMAAWWNGEIVDEEEVARLVLESWAGYGDSEEEDSDEETDHPDSDGDESDDDEPDSENGGEETDHADSDDDESDDDGSDGGDSDDGHSEGGEAGAGGQNPQEDDEGSDDEYFEAEDRETGPLTDTTDFLRSPGLLSAEPLSTLDARSTAWASGWVERARSRPEHLRWCMSGDILRVSREEDRASLAASGNRRE